MALRRGRLLFKGSVLGTLPLLLLSLGLARRGQAVTLPTSPGANGYQAPSIAQAGPEALWMGIYIPTDNLKIAGTGLGNYPSVPGSLMNLYGAGAVMTKGQFLLAVQGLTGSMTASDSQGRVSTWNLELPGLIAEQRYVSGSWEFDAGVAAWLGNFSIALRDGNKYTRFESSFPAGGITGALRWPNNSHICFFARTGYFWLPASGSWQGSDAAAMSKSSFDLNTTFTQAGIDYIF